MKQPPPNGLAAEGRKLWREITASHVVDDAASLTLLHQFCQSVDGLRSCQARIKKDGLMIRGSKGQLRPHPLLASEAAYRRQVFAAIRALRLDIQPEY